MQKIAVTVDIVCLRPAGKPVEILLIQRGKPPFAGQWALPGGFVETDEDLETAARRELYEETSLKPDNIKQFYCFGAPRRDPRGRTISIAYLAFFDDQQSYQAGDDAAAAGWFTLNSLPALAFDHHQIITQALHYV
jgi:8-oxo-dGTP diphosphatase